MNIKKLLLFGILSVFACHLSAQKTERTARELGLMMQEFRGAGFIYKGGAHPEKNRHFRISLNNIYSRRYQNISGNYITKESNINLTLIAGREKRHSLSTHFQFIRGIQASTIFSVQKNTRINSDYPPNYYNYYDENYYVTLGLHYLLGFRYEASPRMAFSLEALPGITIYSRYKTDVTISTGSIYLTATCLLQKKVKDSK